MEIWRSNEELEVKPEMILPGTLSLLSEAYDRCGEVSAEYAKTFYLGTLLMTPERRRAIWAIYALNDENGEESRYQGNYYCYVLKPGVFAAADILSLTIVLGILSFIMVQSAKNRGDSWA